MGSPLSFDEFFKDLCSNYVWFQPATMHHKPETFRSVANKVYMQYVAAESFPPIQEARRHVYNKLVLIPGDRPKGKDWYKIEEQKKEAEKAKEWVPVPEDVRQKKLAELKALVDSLPMLNNFPRTPRTEEVENCDWIPKREKIEPRSEVQVLQVINEHAEKVRTARRKYFLDAYPGASEEEIEAYLKKFDVI